MSNLPKGLFISLTLVLATLFFSTETLAQSTRQKLDEVKLRVCLQRQEGLLKRSEQLTKNALTQQEKFDAVVLRVTDFYTSKVVPSGKIVTNYNGLVSNIGVKKSAVQTALSKAKGDLEIFSCDGVDPKGQMHLFKEDMKVVKQALKEYRTSIRDLIVAVHGVTGNERRSGYASSTSAKPSKNPRFGGTNR